MQMIKFLSQTDDQRRNYTLSPTTEGQSQLKKGQLSVIRSLGSVGRTRTGSEQRRSSGICPRRQANKCLVILSWFITKEISRKVSGQASQLQKAEPPRSHVTGSSSTSKFNQGFPRPLAVQQSESNETPPLLGCRAPRKQGFQKLDLGDKSYQSILLEANTNVHWLPLGKASIFFFLSFASSDRVLHKQEIEWLKFSHYWKCGHD